MADLLNKYSQFTPWVQLSIGIVICIILLGLAYFFKESITAIMKPFCKDKPADKTEKKERKDKKL